MTFTTNVVLSYANNAWKFQPLTHLTEANKGTVQPASFGATRTEAPAQRGRQPEDRLLQRAELLPHHRRPARRLHVLQGPRRQPHHGPGGCDARGAANAENFKRQQDKIVAAITKSGADVVSLMEIENSAQFGKDRDDALAKLVEALNIATPGIWDYVRTPANAPPLADEDMIRTAFIFKKAVAEPVGESVIHNDTVAFASARKPLAQAFKPVGAADDKTFIAIANHFKSKGSGRHTGRTPTRARARPTSPARPRPSHSWTSPTKLQADEGHRQGLPDRRLQLLRPRRPHERLPGGRLRQPGRKSQERRRLRKALLPLRRPGGFPGPHPRFPGSRCSGHRRRHLEHQLRGVRGAGIQQV